MMDSPAWVDDVFRSGKLVPMAPPPSQDAAPGGAAGGGSAPVPPQASTPTPAWVNTVFQSGKLTPSGTATPTPQVSDADQQSTFPGMARAVARGASSLPDFAVGAVGALIGPPLRDVMGPPPRMDYATAKAEAEGAPAPPPGPPLAELGMKPNVPVGPQDPRVYGGEAHGWAERALEAAAGGVGMMPALGPAGRAVQLGARAIPGVAGRVANWVGRGLAEGSTPTVGNIAGQAAGGAGAQVAAEHAPPGWEVPFALGGGAIAAGAPLGAAEMARYGFGKIGETLGRMGIASKTDIGGWTGTGPQARAAAERLDLPGVRQALEAPLPESVSTAPHEYVPNAPLTTAQMAPQLAAQQDQARTIARGNAGAGRGPDLFAENARQQNNAAIAAIRDQAPADAQTDSVGRAVADTLSALEEHATTAESAAVGAARKGVEALGPPASPEEAGKAMQNAVKSEQAKVGGVLTDVYNAIKSNDTMALNIAPMKSAAQQVLDWPSAPEGIQSGYKLPIQLSDMATAIVNMPDVVPMGTYRINRSVVSKYLGDLKENNRLDSYEGHFASQLRGAQNQALTEAVDRAVARDPAVGGRLADLAAEHGGTTGQPGAAAPGASGGIAGGAAEQRGGLVPPGAAGPIAGVAPAVAPSVPKAGGNVAPAGGAGGVGGAPGRPVSGPGMRGSAAITANPEAAAAALRDQVSAGFPGGPGAAGAEGGGIPGARPPLAENITPEAARAYQEVTPKYRQFKEDYGTGPVAQMLRTDRRAPQPSQLPEALLRGETTPEDVRHFLRVAGPGGPEALQRSLIGELHDGKIIQENGEIHRGKLATWWGKREPAITELDKATGGNLAERFSTAAAAQKTLEETRAQIVAEREAFNNSHLAKFVGDDPAVAVRQIDAAAQRGDPGKVWGDVIRGVRHDPAALDGLKRAYVENLLDRIKSGTPSGEGEDMMKVKDLINYVARNKRVIHALYGGQGVQTFDAVVAQFRRIAEANAAPRGSATAARQIGAARAGEGVHGGTISSLLMSVIGERFGERIGEWLGHSMLASTAGLLAGPIISMFRQAGINKIGDLVRMALLHPDVARELLQRYPAGSGTRPVAWNRLAAKIQAASFGGAAGQQETQQ